ncbi:carboxypeptidase-like regulatory domain-containing protein [Gimesia aquarii]|uniref:Carboxypeptidase regulatory-like domain-containing protein n=1 Tax=Gimesia aquarii TaxID=2527964 RepID=A0A517VQ30_9PLAN|nr:carboxypeptidase-like regulatory domain-containing protein [Gimesia aquarii]QDT95125.1 hypothetical protein V144x_05640 [Gimesia aquarii]
MSRVQSIGLILLVLNLTGCGNSGPELGVVTGVVFENGSPISGAMIEFFPEEGITSTGITDEEGKYSLKYNDRVGAVVGRHSVQITPGMAAITNPDLESNQEAPPMKSPPKTIILPEKITVESGKNNIDLKLPGKK